MKNKKKVGIVVGILLATLGATTLMYGFYQGVTKLYLTLWPIESNQTLLINLEAIKAKKPVVKCAPSDEIKKEEPKKTSQVIDVENYVKNIKVKIKPLENSVAAKANNPGNLVYAGQPNAKPVKYAGKTFASYATPELGFRALIKQVEADQSKEMTLAQFINKYAPAHENDTKKYIAFAVDKLNAGKDENIKNLSQIELAKTMAQFESQTVVIEL